MGNLQIARVLGIPIVVNLSWVITLAFVTTMLALRFYPQVIPPGSPYRDDYPLHWVMAVTSGLVFFGSILLHELAHSLVARRQGIPVKNITLFIFGGVSQIEGESRRPMHEFVMAIIGPLTSLFLAGAFFAVWWVTGRSEGPIGLVLSWLAIMNLAIAVFNMAPGFPMDGGRVVRSIIWGVSGNLFRATRLATLLGRGLGYSLMATGGLAFFGTFDLIDPWSGAWLVVLGLFLESQARHSWLQTRALDVLGRFTAEEVMTPEMQTAPGTERVATLIDRAGQRPNRRGIPRFIYFVADDDDERVVGVLTEKEVAKVGRDDRIRTTASDLMRRADEVPVAAPRDDGAKMLQAMEAASVWHLPVVSEGRVIGVVSKESLLRLLARKLVPPRPGLVGQR